VVDREIGGVGEMESWLGMGIFSRIGTEMRSGHNFGSGRGSVEVYMAAGRR
jgi:hypothetical protein